MQFIYYKCQCYIVVVFDLGLFNVKNVRLSNKTSRVGAQYHIAVCEMTSQPWAGKPRRSLRKFLFDAG